MPGSELLRRYSVPAPKNGAAEPKVPALLSAKEFIAGYLAPDYLIDGLIQRARVYSLTGPTGHGKTAVALALAIAKAAGRDLAGRRVEPGCVVYLAAENPDDIRGRVILMAERLALDLDTLPLYFVPRAFNLAGGLDDLTSYVKAIDGASFVIVDTGAAFLAAAGTSDENDNLQALRFALDLRSLTQLPGQPTALALMHPTKYATKDNLLPRGGGAFLNEMDGNLTVWADGDRETTELFWNGKLRGPSFDPITFALETGTCAKLVDAAGRPTPTVWAYPASEMRAEQAAERQRSDEDDILLAMATAPAASFSILAKDLKWMTSDGQPAKYRVQRAVARLAGDKLATKKRDRWTLTNTGKAEAKRLREQAR
jgi:AAA domain